MRIGTRVGLKIGSHFGFGSSDGVTRDATSGIYVPINSSEWTTFRAQTGIAINNPASLWLSQETSGNLADSIGALTLVAVNSPTYQNTVSGWTRKAVGIADNSAQRFSLAAGSGPNPTTTSSLWLCYIDCTTVPVAGRTLVFASQSSGSGAGAGIDSSGNLTTRCVGSLVAGASNMVTGGARPLVFKYDRANSSCISYNDLEKVASTYSASVIDATKGLGDGPVDNAAAARFLYSAMWSGPAAEVSDATVKELLQALGWTIPWS